MPAGSSHSPERVAVFQRQEATAHGTENSRAVRHRHHQSPHPQDSTVVRTDTVWLTAVTNKKDSSLFTLHSSLKRDSSLVEVPITQKHYGDSAYDAWVSGYKAQLDSIHVRNKVTTITNTVYKEKPGNRRWNVSLQTGIGLTTKGAQPYVGIGVGWSLWRW